MRFIYLLLSCTLLCLGISCKNEPSKINATKTNVVFDSLKLQCYADTIVCDMIVRNPDKDDKWMEESLGRFKRDEFINCIFEDIYKGKLIAYDYESQKRLSVEEVKKTEKTKGYSRDIIGKFVTREAWYYDTIHHTFIKKVHSVIFGYEIYDESIGVRKYKPLFKVEF